MKTTEAHATAIAALPYETRMLVLDALRVRSMDAVGALLLNGCTNPDIVFEQMNTELECEFVCRQFNDAGGSPLAHVDSDYFTPEAY